MEQTLMSTTTTTTTIIIIITISSTISCYNIQVTLVSATTTTRTTSIRGVTQHFFLYLLLYPCNNFLGLHPSLKTTASNQKPICTNLHANSIALPHRITSSLNQHLLLVSSSSGSIRHYSFTFKFTLLLAFLFY